MIGKPTANTFSCGTTRETMPNATSVIISASITGAATSSAEAKIVRERLPAPPTSEAICGALSSGTSWKVRARPRSIQASPPIAMKIISPTRM